MKQDIEPPTGAADQPCPTPPRRPRTGGWTRLRNEAALAPEAVLRLVNATNKRWVR